LEGACTEACFDIASVESSLSVPVTASAAMLPADRLARLPTHAAMPMSAWRSKPRWYVVSTEDRRIDPDLERFMAKWMGAKTIEVKASHLSPISPGAHTLIGPASRHNAPSCTTSRFLNVSAWLPHQQARQDRSRGDWQPSGLSSSQMSPTGSNIWRHYFKSRIDLRLTNPTLTMTCTLSLCHNARGVESVSIFARGSCRAPVSRFRRDTCRIDIDAR
jgi:hypothetical protein